MPDTLEFKAKNVDSAVEKASVELKMPKEEIKYEVLSYGSSGIFGLSGTKKAKIRVKLPEDLQVDELKAPSAGFNIETPPASENYDFTGATAAMVIEDEHPRAGTHSQNQPAEPFSADSAESGRIVLQRIVDALTSDAKISLEENADRLCFNVDGGNAGILIGKRGQTLDAIQTIVEKVVNKNHKNRIRVQVDIEGYLATRKENLESMAIRLAEKAKKIGKPISLGQMNAYDRRIVHIALKDYPEVLTRSRGEGPLRKLLIFPKKSSYSKK